MSGRLERGAARAGLIALLAIASVGCGTPTPATPSGGATSLTVLSVVAQDIAFEGGGLSAPAEQGFTIRLDNRDAGIPHGLAIMGGPDMATEVVVGTIIEGPGQTDLSVPTGLVTGMYQLICPVHPSTMAMDLTVGR